MPLTFEYAHLRHTFSKVSELRDALLGSYPGADYLGGPMVLINRDDPAPAWDWVVELLKTRTDWWPAVGIALQHAARDGGERARIALADFLDNKYQSLVLLEWTAPLGNLWPNVVGYFGGLTFGSPDRRLATILAGQRKFWDSRVNAEPQFEIDGIGADEATLSGNVRTATDLAAFLTRSAAVGDQHGQGLFTKLAGGPWSWLVPQLIYHPHVQPLVPIACAALGQGGKLAEISALLDWYYEDHDLWRHGELLEAWQLNPPPWWNQPITRPAKWRYPIRTFAADAKTYGEIALAVDERRNGQLPEMDLARIY